MRVRITFKASTVYWKPSSFQSIIQDLISFVSEIFQINDFAVCYQDSEEDLITLSSDQDFADAVMESLEKDKLFVDLRVFSLPNIRNTKSKLAQNVKMMPTPYSPGSDLYGSPSVQTQKSRSKPVSPYKSSNSKWIPNPPISPSVTVSTTTSSRVSPESSPKTRESRPCTRCSSPFSSTSPRKKRKLSHLAPPIEVIDLSGDDESSTALSLESLDNLPDLPPIQRNRITDLTIEPLEDVNNETSIQDYDHVQNTLSTSHSSKRKCKFSENQPVSKRKPMADSTSPFSEWPMGTQNCGTQTKPKSDIVKKCIFVKRKRYRKEIPEYIKLRVSNWGTEYSAIDDETPEDIAEKFGIKVRVFMENNRIRFPEIRRKCHFMEGTMLSVKHIVDPENNISRLSDSYCAECNCTRFSIDSDETMIQCEHCSKWFHITCVGLNGISLDNVDWICDHCSKITEFETVQIPLQEEHCTL